MTSGQRALVVIGMLTAGAAAWCAADRGRSPAGAEPVSTVRHPESAVRPGIDVLLSDSIGLIAGKRVGLITNPSGVDAGGVPTIDRLARTPGVRLVALFAPEHGIRGTARPGERIADTTDPSTGLPIYSLYGANRAPTAAQLAHLDLVAVDLQDVGARTFTYISTVIHAMRAVRAAGKRIVVLDRPNPIGCVMQGPVLEPAHASFIGMLPVPLRHGLTMGELARFANAELRVGADLVVVPAQGWRCEWFDQTGLPWVRPSPNLPDLEALAWYPGTVLFEATNLSVGRGTEAPFTFVGAPWLVVPVVHLQGGPYAYAFEPVTLTPRSPGDGKYDGVAVRGRRFERFDRRRGDAVIEALNLMTMLKGTSPDSVRVDARGLAQRLGINWPLETTIRQDPWLDQRRAFRARVAPYLLYPR